MPRSGKGGAARLWIAEAQLPHDIAAAFLHTRRTGLGGRQHVRHALPRRIVGDDPLGRVLRRRQALGHRESDRLADISHGPAGQKGHGQGADRPAPGRIDSAHEGQIADTVAGQVVPGNDPHDAVDAQGRRDIQSTQTRRRMG